MRTTSRSIALACLAIMITCLAGVALAVTSFDTSLTISFSRASGGQFSGRVKSPKHACIVDRKVTVYRKRSGRDPAVGSDRSNAKGRWRVNPARVAAGNYYAKTAAIQLQSGAGRCSAARSVTTHAS